MSEKRKTKTSSAVKDRYNAKVYSSVNIRLPKDLVHAFKEKCKAQNIPQAQIIRCAIEQFLDE